MERRGIDLRRRIILVLGLFGLILLGITAMNFIGSSIQRDRYDLIVRGLQAKQNSLLAIQGGINNLLSMENQFDFSLNDDLHMRTTEEYKSVISIFDAYEAAQAVITPPSNPDYEEHINDIRDVKSQIDSFWKTSQAIHDLTVQKGLTEDAGLRGYFRSAAHALEAVVVENNYTQLRIEYLQMRRHEKDYLLRLEQKFIDENLASQETIRGLIPRLVRDPLSRDELLANMDTYQKGFSQIVDANNQLHMLYDQRLSKQKELISVLNSELKEANNEVSTELPAIRKKTASLIATSMTVSGISILIGVLMAVYLVYTIQKPLRIALKSAALLAQGNLAERNEYKGKNEMGEIISGINLASLELSELIGRVTKISDSASNMSQNLAEASEETQAAVTQIQANITSLLKMADELLVLSDKTHGDAGNIDDDIQDLNKLIEHESAGVVESTASIEQMIANIQNVTGISRQKETSIKELLEVTHDSGVQIKQTYTLTEEISGLAKNIMDITRIINGIASQTNLLAMNAAIEAAHAGESGRGFAVVASEIRKLAESSASNAGQISEMLKHITERISTVAETSRQSTLSFEKINQEVDSFTHSFTEIVSAMNEMSIGSSQILEASESMKDGLTQISDKSGNIGVTSEQIRGTTEMLNEHISNMKNGTDEISLALSHISESTQSVSEMAQRNLSDTEELSRSLDSFTI